MKKKEDLSTKSIHFCRRNEESTSQKIGSTHPPLDWSTTFSHHKDTRRLVDAFQGRTKSFTYARNSSPTVEVLEKFVTTLEDGIESACFSSGMASIASLFLALLKKGDHIIVSQYLFGNTVSFFKTLKRLGFDIDFVNTCNIDEVKKHFRKETRFVFFETISNPTTQVPDIPNLSTLCQEKNVISIVDNTITTPFLFQPKHWGFTFSQHSLSKYLAGHGEALGGSVTDLGNYNWDEDENIIEMYKERSCLSKGIFQIKKKAVRDMGPSLSPTAAARILTGSETLTLRMSKHMENATAIAHYLEGHKKVEKVYYPGLKKHPQYEIIEKCFTGASGILSFSLKGNCDPVAFLDHLDIIIPATHLGDTRSLAIPVAQTIFYEMGVAGRKEIGISENLIRLSVGIEDTQDLIADIEQALAHQP